MLLVGPEGCACVEDGVFVFTYLGKWKPGTGGWEVVGRSDFWHVYRYCELLFPATCYLLKWGMPVDDVWVGSTRGE